jgi:hypothetical protein
MLINQKFCKYSKKYLLCEPIKFFANVVKIFEIKVFCVIFCVFYFYFTSELWEKNRVVNFGLIHVTFCCIICKKRLV